MICEFCSKEFTPKDNSLSHRKRYRFCSKRCAYNARIGKTSPMKGKTYSDEVRRKMSLAKKGKPSPRKGVKLSEETRRKLSESHKGIPCSDGAKKKLSLYNKGEKSRWWKGGISKHYKEGYYSLEYRNWRMAVFQRDSFTCQGCRNVGIYLTAHHIKAWARYPELRFTVSNGVTLCEECHKLTDNYKGRGMKKN